MRKTIATLLAISAAAYGFTAVAQEVTKPKRTTQAEMLAAVCNSKAVMSDKLRAACEDSKKIAGLQLASVVTVKAPTAELKVLYANREFFK